MTVIPLPRESDTLRVNNLPDAFERLGQSDRAGRARLCGTPNLEAEEFGLPHICHYADCRQCKRSKGNRAWKSDKAQFEKGLDRKWAHHFVTIVYANLEAIDGEVIKSMKVAALAVRNSAALREMRGAIGVFEVSRNKDFQAGFRPHVHLLIQGRITTRPGESIEDALLAPWTTCGGLADIDVQRLSDTWTAEEKVRYMNKGLDSKMDDEDMAVIIQAFGQQHRAIRWGVFRDS